MTMKNKIEKTGFKFATSKFTQSDLFIADIVDAIPHVDRTSLQVPFFTLSKKPDLKPFIYSSDDGKLKLTVEPPALGRPSIYDQDLLLFGISQLQAAIEEGREVSPRIRVVAHEYFHATNRSTGGKSYDNLEKTLKRLYQTEFYLYVRNGAEATVRPSKEKLISDFIYRVDERANKVIDFEFTLGDVLFRSVCEGSVRKLNQDYFRLRSGIDRRIYQIASACLESGEDVLEISELQKRAGSTSVYRSFKHTIKILAENNYLPDFDVVYDENSESIRFIHVKNKCLPYI